MGWQDYRTMVTSIDSTLDPRRFGVLPWQLFWTYRKLVALMAPTDSTPVALDDVLRTAADLGHYLADAHVPLHTTGNYNGQRTNQTGIHALWETHNVEHLMSSNTCACRSPPDYDPSWTPWDILKTSHDDVQLVLAAEAEWRRLTQVRGWALRRRGRTLSMLPSPEALNCWDSLTGHRTWPRFCETSHIVASAWVSAWHDAGTPTLRQSGPSTHERGMLYLFKTWLHERFRAHSFVGPLSRRVPCRLEPRRSRRTHPTWTSRGTQDAARQPLEVANARCRGHLGPRVARHTSPDVLLTTDMCDLAQLKGLLPASWHDVKCVVMFHENQLTFPWSPTDQDPDLGRDLAYSYINVSSALAADQVWFNSAHHRDVFLKAVDLWMSKMPKPRLHQRRASQRAVMWCGSG